MDLAPQDVLVEVFRRLPPRSLAACRCVRKAWRAAIDGNRLLRADLLPLALDGVFYGTCPPTPPMLFSSRAMGRRVTGKLEYLDEPLEDIFPIMDCCNGLLLMWDHVVNPATRQWVRLPALPPSCAAPDCTYCTDNRYLVYDPTLSPHFEVFLIPKIPALELPADHVCMHICKGESVSAMEWPPSPYIMHTFSSKNGCWKERRFIRQVEAAGTVASVKSVYEPGPPFFLYTAYWKGALYVRCEDNFFLRIDLLHDTYRVIEFPNGNKGYNAPRLGKSEKGVYCAFCDGRCTFQVWFLDESHGRMEWVLKNTVNLEPVEQLYPSNHVDDVHWVVQSDDQMEWVLKNDTNDLQPSHDNDKANNFDWDSDNEYVVSTKDWVQKGDSNDDFYCCFGFHPYKEVVLFHGRFRTVAFHFDTSKLRDLGEMYYGFSELQESFPCAPCWKRNLPGSK